MTDTITIPPEAVEKAARQIAEPSEWSLLTESWQERLREIARAAILAALEAWPGMHKGHQCTGCGGDPQIILPLNTEPSDE